MFCSACLATTDLLAEAIGTDGVAVEIFVHAVGVIEDYEYVGFDPVGNERRIERIAAWAAVDISG